MRVLVAGVDTSTQSCKVELRDAADFRLVARGTAAHPPVTPPCSEQHPEDWWRAFVEAFRAALAGAPEGSRVAAISVGGQCHGLVPLDAAGVPLRAAKLWNDTTTAPDLEPLVARIGAERFIERTGSLPTAAFTISKLAGLAAHEPETLRALRTALLPHDYVTFRLTGERVTDRSEASGTGYFDADADEYVWDFLEAVSPELDWPSIVPRVAGPDEVVGVLHADALRELGLSGEVVVGAGGGDQHVSAVGLGLAPGELVIALGTSGVIFTPTPRPVRDPSGIINGVAAVQGGFLPLACTLNSTKVTDAFARWLSVDHGALSDLALAAGDEGPVLVAYLDGERTPNRPNARGLLVDLTSDTTREQLARAAYEGVVFGLRAGVEQLNALGVETPGAALVVGGGARAEAYRRFLADALQRTVRLPQAEEAVARGAAVQAYALHAGVPLLTAMAELRPDAPVVAEPTPQGAERWERYRQAAALTALDR
ncbi:MAG: xylulokinase [Arachnia sp.]